MRAPTIGVIAVAILAAQSVGPRAAVASVTLTIEDAIERAAAAHPSVRRARAELRAVESRRIGAALRLPSNPVLGGTVGALQVFPQTVGATAYPGGVATQWGLRLEQSVEVGGQRAARLREVERAVTAGRERERLAIAETRARVRSLYLDALVAAERAENERVRERLAHQLQESVALRVRLGAASGVDLALAQSESGRTTAARIEAELDQGSALERLRTATALPAGEPILLGTPLSPPPGEVAVVAELTAQALARRAELAALEATAAELDAQLVRLEREAVPTPTLFVDLAVAPEVASQPGQLYAGGGLAVPLPLVRRNQGERAVASAERSRVGVERSSVERQILEDVALAREQLVRRRAETALFEQSVIPAAEQAYQLTDEGYRSGKFDLFRVITAARDVAQARRERLTALGATWQARIALDRATGEP